MKRIMKMILVLVVSLILLGCNEKVDFKQVIRESFKEITLPEETETDLEFQETINYLGYCIDLEWSTSNKAITSDGIVTRTNEDVTVDIFLKGTIEDVSYQALIATVKVLKLEVIEEAFTEEDILTALETINIPDQVYYDLEFIDEINYLNQKILLNWETNSDYLDNNGEILYSTKDLEVIITCQAKALEFEVTKEYKVTLLSAQNACIKASEELVLPNSIDDDIDIPKMVGSIDIDWSSSDDDILDTSGKCFYVANDTDVTLYAGFYVDLYEGGEYFYDVEYIITVKPFTAERRLKEIKDQITVPNRIYRNISLNTKFDYNITGTWVSSDPDVLSNTGVVNNKTENQEVTLTVELTVDNKKASYSYKTVVVGNHETEDEIYVYNHNIIDRVAFFDTKRMHNVEVDNGKLVLKDDALTGYYESKVFKTVKFDEVVGSYACITNKQATAELEISVCVNGTWTKYFSYGNWGLGLNNLYYNQDDTLAKMSVDEIMVKSGSASAVKYRITLRRDSLTTTSPKLSLVAMTLSVTDSDYVYGITADILPTSADNDLPKLYQYDVKQIGGSICSATTTTMLLKWKGHDFTEEAKTYENASLWGQYEHGYIASLVADRGHNSPTYGNWSYNMITAGAFGEDAYVGRMYSWEEVKEYLANHGPLGASIKSPTGLFGYTTNGHLIVVRGYRETETGDTIVICNDPAVKGTYYEVRLYQFMGCWGGVVYIVE